jgi:hypothetical protein
VYEAASVWRVMVSFVARSRFVQMRREPATTFTPAPPFEVAWTTSRTIVAALPCWM